MICNIGADKTDQVVKERSFADGDIAVLQASKFGTKLNVNSLMTISIEISP